MASLHVCFYFLINFFVFLKIKSKFDSEFRRFSLPINTENFMSYLEFRGFIETIHSLHNIPFTLSYTSYSGDLLPITNNDVCF